MSKSCTGECAAAALKPMVRGGCAHNIMRLTSSLAAATEALAAALTANITLNGSTALHVYDGHGALSAGASSRLLWDYPEPYRSDILDYLFKPGFGAALHMLKVEIGGDCQSTDGTEPSHMHNRTDLNCQRGYEFWLLSEAKKRNPDIKTYALSWGVPYWVGNGTYFSADNWAYQTQFLTCVRETLNFDMDYIGIWNERSWGSVDYVVNLRNTLDAAGFTNTEIILPDGWDVNGPVNAAEANETFKDAIGGIGLHYPCNHPAPQVQLAIQKKYWASEDYSTVADWAGGGCWGRILNQNYIRMNMTSTISWSLIWAVYPNLPYFGNGLMYSMEPWSGHYDVMSPIWTSAHWTQFTQPGWRFLHVPGNGSGTLPGGGSYVTLVPPSNTSQMTVILESLQGNCLRCAGETTQIQTVTFKTTGGLPGPGTTLHVWLTTETSWFQQQPDIIIAPDSTFTVTLPEDAMMTVSTVSGASHGNASTPVPASVGFPLPYSDDFENYPFDMLAHYFSDNGGSFSVRNGVLNQVVTQDPGPNGWVHTADPISLIGDGTWMNYTVSVDFSLTQPSSMVSLDAYSAMPSVKSRLEQLAGKRAGVDSEPRSTTSGGGIPGQLLPCDATSAYQTWAFDTPSAQFLSNTVRDNQLCLNLDGCQSDVIYYPCVTSGGTCCGASCYANEQWTWGTGPLSDHLSSALLTGQCLTWRGRALSMTPCNATDAAQRWTYNSTSGQLQLSGTNTCLSAPPPVTYAQVCGRMLSSGYCARVGDSGVWSLMSGGTSLASGNITGFDSNAWHSVSLTMSQTTISMSVNGTTLASVQDSKYTAGMAAVGSGYHWAAFDNFALTAA